MLDLAEAFRKHGDKIVEQWVQYVLDTYNSSSFFLKEKDAFANPTGAVIRKSLHALFLLFAKNANAKEYKPNLESLMQLRAVQDFSPSQAIAPINGVKHITREILGKDSERKHLIADLYDFEFCVDVAVLNAFDIYMECRERLYEVRIQEIKSKRHILTDSKCPSRLVTKIATDSPEKERNN